MSALIKKLWLHPAPVRFALGKLISRFELLPYETRVECMMADRPHYAYSLLRAAQLARSLNISAISALEFGVAGGNGLINLEYHAEQIEKITGVHIELYGFDTAEGLPEPQDYRDLPYHWKRGFFKMDRTALQKKLKSAKLVIGDVKETAKSFVSDYQPAPIGAIFHDLDFYSSTADSFAIFNADSASRLPRVFNYFDDVIGDEIALYNDYTGELAAIKEFNEANAKLKFAKPAYMLQYPHIGWTHQYYVLHDFEHPRYNDFVSTENQQLPIQSYR